jgi:2-amino-4-hydroxy-6-hydroxymethyldihydropteridine diphosphokinase
LCSCRAMGKRAMSAESKRRHGERFAVGLGSNLGDRLANLRLGVRAVAAHCDDLLTSAVYETAAVGFEEQGPFLNACCVGWTRLAPRQLLSELQDAERRSGRRRGGPRFGPRELDLDVLLYADLNLHTGHLTIPHPRLRERAFVLAPLAEIAGDWVVPASGDRDPATVGELLRAVSQVGIARTELEL